MIAPVRVLETSVFRSPLGVRLIDPVRGSAVTAGMTVTAWPWGDPLSAVSAVVSPFSAVHGFGALPGLRDYELGRRPASDWCDGSPPPGPNFVIAVNDRLGRFLPQTLPVCLPRDRLLVLVLFSAPSRPVPAGMAVIRGQLAVADDPGAPAAWAFVSASVGGGPPATTMADTRGMYLLAMPHPEDLPALPGSPPPGTGPALTWPVAVRVRCQPSALRWPPGTSPDAPPELRSILTQDTAAVHDTPGVGRPSVTRTLTLGRPLVVATTGAPELRVVPA